MMPAAGPARSTPAAVTINGKPFISPHLSSRHCGHVSVQAGHFVDLQELVRRDILQCLSNPTWPADFDRANLRFLSQPEVHALVTRRHEADADGNVVVKQSTRGSRQLGRVAALS